MSATTPRCAHCWKCAYWPILGPARRHGWAATLAGQSRRAGETCGWRAGQVRLVGDLCPNGGVAGQGHLADVVTGTKDASGPRCPATAARHARDGAVPVERLLLRRHATSPVCLRVPLARQIAHPLPPRQLTPRLDPRHCRPRRRPRRRAQRSAVSPRSCGCSWR
jgi:hypothetical protein